MIAEIKGAKGEKAPAKVFGVTPDLPEISRLSVHTGRFINREDLESSTRVCVLGSEARRQIFAFEEALGRKLKIGDRWFTCIGVMEDKSFGRSRAIIEVRNVNLDVYIPMTTAIELFPLHTEMAPITTRASFRRVMESMQQRGVYEKSPISEVIIQVSTEDKILEVAHLIKRVLQRKHERIEDF